MKPELEQYHKGTQFYLDIHQELFEFSNGYGASVVKGPYTYGGKAGLYELAVTKWNAEGTDFDLCYTTPITNDVIGYLTWDQVECYLDQIKNLDREN